MFTEKTIDTETQCYHCGDELPSKPYVFDDRQFCCLGCKGVHKIGLVNGLLPCGFVYLALAGALNTGNIQNAVSYMFWFGLGTVPLMFIATFSMGFTAQLLRKRKYTYLSPQIPNEATICK